MASASHIAPKRTKMTPAFFKFLSIWLVVTRKKTAKEKWPREILGARGTRNEE